MVYVETETASTMDIPDDQSLVAESNTVQLKSLQGCMSEMKLNAVEACQQLFGGIEKELGEMGCSHFENNAEDPIFEMIEIFALTII